MLRLGAHCLYHAKNCLGEFYRKMKWRLGAVTATAHKLARIVYHLLSTPVVHVMWGSVTSSVKE